METKFCPRCVSLKSTEDFWKSRANKDGFHSWCKDCKYKAQTESDKKNYEQRLRRGREYTQKLRKLALAKLGNVCCKCGVSDFRCIQIDHINGGGCKENKGGHKPHRLYRDIVNNPNANLIYQLLCANCNQIKKWEKLEGIHKETVEAAAAGA